MEDNANWFYKDRVIGTSPSSLLLSLIRREVCSAAYAYFCNERSSINMSHRLSIKHYTHLPLSPIFTISDEMWDIRYCVIDA